MMLMAAISALGDVPAHATANPVLVAMATHPEGRAPGKAPALAAMAEAELETRRSAPPSTGNNAPYRGIGYEPLPSLSHLLQHAAAGTALKQALNHAHDYPRDPHLRLNHGHAPPKG